MFFFFFFFFFCTILLVLLALMGLQLQSAPEMERDVKRRYATSRGVILTDN